MSHDYARNQDPLARYMRRISGNHAIRLVITDSPGALGTAEMGQARFDMDQLRDGLRIIRLGLHPLHQPQRFQACFWINRHR